MMKDAERRKAERHNLEKLDQMTLTLPDGSGVLVRICDISPFGARFQLVKGPKVATGDELTVKECPKELQTMLGSQRCKVVWTSAGLLGAEFPNPLQVTLTDPGANVEFVEY